MAGFAVHPSLMETGQLVAPRASYSSITSSFRWTPSSPPTETSGSTCFWKVAQLVTAERFAGLLVRRLLVVEIVGVVNMDVHRRPDHERESSKDTKEKHPTFEFKR